MVEMPRLSSYSLFLFFVIWISCWPIPGGIDTIHGREYVHSQPSIARKLHAIDCSSFDYSCDENNDNCLPPKCYCDKEDGYICKDVPPVPVAVEEECNPISCSDDDDECPGHCFCDKLNRRCEDCIYLGCLPTVEDEDGMEYDDDACPKDCYCDANSNLCRRLSGIADLVHAYGSRGN